MSGLNKMGIYAVVVAMLTLSMPCCRDHEPCIELPIAPMFSRVEDIGLEVIILKITQNGEIWLEGKVVQLCQLDSIVDQRQRSCTNSISRLPTMSIVADYTIAKLYLDSRLHYQQIEPILEIMTKKYNEVRMYVGCGLQKDHSVGAWIRIQHSTDNKFPDRNQISVALRDHSIFINDMLLQPDWNRESVRRALFQKCSDSTRYIVDITLGSDDITIQGIATLIGIIEEEISPELYRFRTSQRGQVWGRRVPHVSKVR